MQMAVRGVGLWDQCVLKAHLQPSMALRATLTDVVTQLFLVED